MSVYVANGLTQEQQSTIEVLMRWDLTKPKRYLIQREGITPAEADRLEIEYKKFQALNVLYGDSKDVKFPISGPVDKMWHTHLMYPGNYVGMCMATKGALINHLPTTSEEERLALSGHYLNSTLPTLERLFGPRDEEMWPADAQICWCCCGSSEDQF